MSNNGLNNKIRREANGAYKSLMCFEFVFNLHLMDKVMGITNVLCKQFQLQSQDIVNAMNLVLSTKSILSKLRESGWEAFIGGVVSFCEKEGIDIPDLNGPHMEDFQLMELESSFGKSAIELLTLSSTLDPRDAFKSFDIDKICSLAERFYPEDFKDDEIRLLREELLHYEFEFSHLLQFQNMSSLSQLCQELVKTRKTFPLIEILIRLVLTLPISTATTERAFSSMKLIKTRLRNKMEDGFLGHCMILHIEKELVDDIDIDSIIDEFNALKTRRVQLK